MHINFHEPPRGLSIRDSLSAAQLLSALAWLRTIACMDRYLCARAKT